MPVHFHGPSTFVNFWSNTNLFYNKLGINFAVWAAVLKSEMTTFWSLFEFGLIFLEIFNVNFIPTGTLFMLLNSDWSTWCEVVLWLVPQIAYHGDSIETGYTATSRPYVIFYLPYHMSHAVWVIWYGPYHMGRINHLVWYILKFEQLNWTIYRAPLAFTNVIFGHFEYVGNEIGLSVLNRFWPFKNRTKTPI